MSNVENNEVSARILPSLINEPVTKVRKAKAKKNASNEGKNEPSTLEADLDASWSHDEKGSKVTANTIASLYKSDATFSTEALRKYFRGDADTRKKTKAGWLALCSKYSASLEKIYAEKAKKDHGDLAEISRLEDLNKSFVRMHETWLIATYFLRVGGSFKGHGDKVIGPVESLTVTSKGRFELTHYRPTDKKAVEISGSFSAANLIDSGKPLVDALKPEANRRKPAAKPAQAGINAAMPIKSLAALCSSVSEMLPAALVEQTKAKQAAADKAGKKEPVKTATLFELADTVKEPINKAFALLMRETFVKEGKVKLADIRKWIEKNLEGVEVDTKSQVATIGSASEKPKDAASGK